MIEIHHGTFYQDEANDLFTIILTFPIHNKQMSNPQLNSVD